MAQTFQGDVSFELDSERHPYRFEVSVTDESKILVWIEDRKTKKQWTTAALEIQDFVTEENAIPRAKARDYAERFAACLGSIDDAVSCTHALTSKGVNRMLKLTIPLFWATFELSVEYKFVLAPVPLAQIDLLIARMRDVEEKVSTLDQRGDVETENTAMATVAAETKRLGERVDQLDRLVAQTPVFVQARTTSQFSASETLTWVTGEGAPNGRIEFAIDGEIHFAKAGVFAIQIGVTHSGVRLKSNRGFDTYASTSAGVFELRRGGKVLASCQGSSHSDITTTPLHYILKAAANDAISVVYTGGGSAQVGSYITILKL